MFTNTMPDPTYTEEEIRANPEWEIAFFLSELDNDIAPIGWSKYIWKAKCLLDAFSIQRKEK